MDSMNRQRVEAITDGIIAIAATIMVLELKIPSIQDWAGLLEIRHTFFAYLSSFFIIYIVWSMHHDLFRKAEVLTRRAFMINGVWIFFLTLVPFTTAWISNAPDATVSEFFYPLNLLLWCGAFQWLSWQIRKDNQITTKDASSRSKLRIFMYVIFAVCIILSFIKPVLSLYVIWIATVVMLVWTFISKGKNK